MNDYLHITHNDGDAVGCAIVLDMLEKINYEDFLDSRKSSDFKTSPVELRYMMRDSEETGNWKHEFCSISKMSERNIDVVFSKYLDFWELNPGKFPKSLIITDISLNEENVERLSKFLQKHFHNYEKYRKREGQRNFVSLWNSESMKGTYILCVDHHPTNVMKPLNDIGCNVVVHSGKISAAMLLLQYFLYIETMENSFSWVESSNISDLYDRMTMDMISLFFLNRETDIRRHLCKYVSFAFFRFIFNISRYDTYEWKKNPGVFGDEDFITVLCKRFGPEITTDILEDIIFNYNNRREMCSDLSYCNSYFLNSMTNPFIPKMYDKLYGEAKHLERIAIKNCLTNGYIVTDFDGHHVALMNNIYHEHLNSCMEAVYKKENPKGDDHPNIEFVLCFDENTGKASFRTNLTTIHLGELAKTYGGGGHAQASGVTFSKDKLNELILIWEKEHAKNDN